MQYEEIIIQNTLSYKYKIRLHAYRHDSRILRNVNVSRACVISDFSMARVFNTLPFLSYCSRTYGIHTRTLRPILEERNRNSPLVED